MNINPRPESLERLRTSKTPVVLLPIASLLWFGSSIWSKTEGDAPPGLLLDAIRLPASLIVIYATLVILPALLSKKNAGSTSLFLFASWMLSSAVSAVIHRSASSTLEDSFLSTSSFGLLPLGRGPAGSAAGWIILMLIAAASARGLSSSRKLEGEAIQSAPPSHDVALDAIMNTTTSWTGTRFHRFSTLAFLCAFGTLLFADSIYDLFARQHVERASVDSYSGEVISIMGPVLPTFVWSAIAAGLLGVLLLGPVLVVLGGFGRRREFECGSRPLSMLWAGAWITALAFWVRVATLLTVAPTRTDGGDPLFYHVTANLLARGRGFPEPLNFIAFERWIPSALHGPAYPIVLSLSSRIGGTTYFDHKILSILIGTAVVVLTMALARLVAPEGLRRPAIVIAGLLASLYPNLWIVDSVLFPEGLMALLTLGIVYASYSWWKSPRVATAVVIGCLLGASALTRGEGLLLSILLVVPLFLSARGMPWKKRLSQIVVAGSASLFVIAPWTIRNAASFDSFVPLSTNGNELFVYANCPPVYEGKFLGFWLFQCQEDIRSSVGEPPGDEAEKALYWRQQGLDYARENASDLPRVLAARIGRQWDLFRPWQNTDFAPIEGRNKDAARVGLISYYSMIPFALAGLRILRRNGTRLLPIGAVFASVTLTAAYAYGTTRFRVPFEPLLCLVAAVGIASLLARLRTRWQPSLSHARRNVLGSSTRSPSFVEGGRIRLQDAMRRRSAPSWLSFVIVGTGILLALPALFRSVGSSMEEGFMLVFPELVSNGAVPNVDFLHLYGPTSLYFLAGWFELFSVSLTAERAFGLLQHLLFVSGLMVLVRPWGRSVSTAVGLASLLFVLTPVGLQALAWNGAIGLAVWALVCALRASSAASVVSWAASGILAGFALGFRPDFALGIALAVGFVISKSRLRHFLSFAAGAATGLIPVFVHLVRAGVPATFQGIFLDPVFSLRPGRELPRPPSLDRLDGALQVIAEKFAPWWGLPHIGAPKQLFLWFFLLPMLSFAIVMVARSMATHRLERRVLVSASLFGIGLLPQAVQRPDSAHFLWVSAFVFPMSIVAGIELIRRRSPRSNPTSNVLKVSAGFLVAVVGLIPFYTMRSYGDLVVRSVSAQLDVREVRRGDRFFYLGDERPWRASLEVVEDLDSMATPGQRLFVGPMDLRQTAYSDVFFYHLFPDLVPATYYIEMDPGLANEDPRLADDVSSADWLILTRFWSGWIEPNSSIVFGSDEPNTVVEESFCLRASYQNDVLRLYEKCAEGDGMGPYEGPYEPEHDYAVEVLVPVPRRPDGSCTPTCDGLPSESGVEIGIDTSIVE